MNEKTITQLKEYEALMLKKRGLENELEAMKEELLPQLPRDTAIDTDTGRFTVESRTKWVYSSKTKKLKEELKDAEQREQQDGSAKATDGTPFLVYREGHE